jgi:hypothetical protein
VSGSQVDDYVLIPDGHGGLRMAPAGAARRAFRDEDTGPLETEAAGPQLTSVDTAPAEAPEVVSAVRIGRLVLALALLCGVGLVAGAVLLNRPPPGAPAPVVVALAGAAPPAVVAPSVAAPQPDVQEARPAVARPHHPAAVTHPARARHSPTAHRAAMSHGWLNGHRTTTRPQACGPSIGARTVCADPELRAADRDMHDALRAATEAGVPWGELRREQAQFRAQRNTAARRSPEAVGRLYDRRIRRLQDEADARS